MTIREAVLNADTLDKDSTVYGIFENEAWTAESVCFLIKNDEESAIIIQRDGQELHYFLEVDGIFEVIEGWLATSRSIPSQEELVHVVIHYAQYDAWPQPNQ